MLGPLRVCAGASAWDGLVLTGPLTMAIVSRVIGGLRTACSLKIPPGPENDGQEPWRFPEDPPQVPATLHGKPNRVARGSSPARTGSKPAGDEPPRYDGGRLTLLLRGGARP